MVTVARRRMLSLGTPFSYLAGVLIVGITLVPLLYTVLGGFRTNAQLNEHPVGVPHPWVTGNYADVFSAVPFLRYTFNTMTVAILSTRVLVLVTRSSSGWESTAS